MQFPYRMYTLDVYFLQSPKQSIGYELSHRVHTVRDEILKADPQEGLRQVFQFANLEASKSQIEEMVKATDISRIAKKGEGQYVRSSSVGDWKQHLSAAEIILCNKMALELIQTELVRSRTVSP